jgi:hypothetical protein
VDDFRVPWESQLDTDPANWQLRWIYADRLEEAGLEELAVAQRWMADNEKCPWTFGRSGRDTAWFNYRMQSEMDDHSDLPSKLVVLLPNVERIADATPDGYWRAMFDSRRAAEEALAVILYAYVLGGKPYPKAAAKER